MPLREVVKQAILTGVPYLSRVCGHRCRKRGGIHAASGSFEEGRLNKNRDAHLCATPVFTEYILWNIGKVSKVVAYFAENAAQYMPSRGSLDMGGRIKKRDSLTWVRRLSRVVGSFVENAAQYMPSREVVTHAILTWVRYLFKGVATVVENAAQCMPSRGVEIKAGGLHNAILTWVRRLSRVVASFWQSCMPSTTTMGVIPALVKSER